MLTTMKITNAQFQAIFPWRRDIMFFWQVNDRHTYLVKTGEVSWKYLSNILKKIP